MCRSSRGQIHLDDFLSFTALEKSLLSVNDSHYTVGNPAGPQLDSQVDDNLGDHIDSMYDDADSEFSQNEPTLAN